MIKKVITVLLLLFAFLNFASKIKAQSEAPQDLFLRAKVEAITNQGETVTDSVVFPFQELKLLILDAPEKGKVITVEYGKDVKLNQSDLTQVGQTLVLDKTTGPDNTPSYQVTDKYRLNNVWPIILFFFLVVLVLSQWKGAGSILGMIISLGVILEYVVPQILSGHNPLTVSIIGCLVIMVTTIYLAHGFSTKTTIAVISTFITLVEIGLLSALFVKITFLTGLGSEDAASLQLGNTSSIDFKGLLLGGILIGALGVLDDITTGLSASVFELYKANSRMTFKELFASGLSIGKEHISSLVNTLVLAYAGAVLPIFIMINLNVNRYPIWSILNDGLIIEEVVRTLAGSIGLVAAVPLTTLMATFYLTRRRIPSVAVKKK